MTPSGPSPLGEGPDDDTGGASEHVGERELFDDGMEDATPRGWVPPEDRLWRHPSELEPRAEVARDAPGREPAPVGPEPSRSRSTRRYWTMALVGTGAAAAMVAGVLLMEDAGSNQSTSALSPTTSTTLVLSSTPTAGSGTVVPAVASDTERAMVALTVTTPRGTNHGCGVVVQAGGLIVTTADAVAGATKVTAMTASGHLESATVIATDPTSDIALLRVPDDLPTASFADDAEIPAGRPAMVLEMTSQRAASGPVARWAGAVVQSVGLAVPGTGANGMAGIRAATASLSTVPGAVLIDSTGAVIGISDPDGTTSSAGGDVYLPTDLVVGVAGDLAATGKVAHGWLDMEGHDAGPQTVVSDSPTTTVTPASGSVEGAQVVSVAPGGVSAGALHAGDVIVALDGSPVRSMAELRSRLYVLAAGTPVQLTVVRGATRITVTVDLSSRS